MTYLPPRFRGAVVRSTVQSILTGVLGQGALFVSGVLVARALGPEDRGYLALVALVPVVITIIGVLGLDLAVVYFVSRDPSHSRAIAAAVRRPGLVQAAALAAVHTVAVLIMVRNGPSGFRTAGLVSLAVIPAMVAQDYGLALLQGLRRFTPFNVLRLMPAVSYAVALLTAILVGFDHIAEIAVVWTATVVASGIAALVAGVRALPPSDDGSAPPPKLREMARFGVASLLGSATPVETFRLDVAVTGLFLAPASLGLYVAAASFTNLPRFIAESAGTVAYPYVSAETDPAAAKAKAWRFFWAVLGLSTTVALVLGLSAGWVVPFLFGDSFTGAVPIARILLVSAVLLSARRILAEGMRGAGYPSANSVAEAASWAWLLPALAVFVPRWGVTGVAAALSTSAAISLLVLMYRIGTFRRPPAAAGQPPSGIVVGG